MSRTRRVAVVTAGVVVGILSAACGAQGHLAASGSGAPSPSAGSSTTAPLGTDVANPLRLGKVVFTANFSDPAQAWPIVSGPDQSLSLSGNSYVVELKRSGQAVPLPTLSGVTPTDLVNVGVSATFQLTKVAPGDGVGVVCRDIHSHAYMFSVVPASSSRELGWSITRQDTSASPTDTSVNRQLASGTVPALASSQLSLEGDCVGGGKEKSPVRLVMSLGSQVIGQATDTQIPPPYFGAATIAVFSAKGATSATFSGFQIRAASAS